MKNSQILPFIKNYLDFLSDELGRLHPEYRLTNIQKGWLSFCLTGILLTNSICWRRYERMSMGSWLIGSLSWMFRRSKINWDKLLIISVKSILSKYGVSEGELEIDDTDRERSKNAKKLYKLGKQKDKKSGGYFNGQSILFLLLVTEKITIPVGFVFYEMDPILRVWDKEDRRLRKKKVKKRHRPEKPERDASYPTKNELAIGLVRDFKTSFVELKIRSIKADALYGTGQFMDGVRSLYPTTQVISQIRNNQKIVVNGQEYDITKYFSGRAEIKSEMIIRGGKREIIYYSSVIAKVAAHGKKRLIIALKYEGEASFRYIIAADMTWRVQDVLASFSLRWLVEVFFQDWKLYEGWGQLTKHVGVEGSRQSLILSLLFDHCLLSHPTQVVLAKNNLPLCTVGSLRDKLAVQSLLQFFEFILEQPDPKKYLSQLAKNIDNVYKLRASSKHLSGRAINWNTS
jgi:hypothetical protein